MTEPMEIEETDNPVEDDQYQEPVNPVVYFGAKWDSPQFDGATEVSTPVGGVCGYCSELIDDGDAGTFSNFGIVNAPVHLECMLRAALGSPAHLRGECSCSGAEEPEDNRSWREQGAAVIQMILDKQGIFSNTDNKEQEQG